MNLNARLQKLREDKKLIIEALRVAEHKASTRQRKADTRAKIIWGGAFLALPPGERELVESMLRGRMTERDRQFINEHSAGDQDAGEASPTGLN
ncbi:MAG: hypothetical protein INR62_02035 [Rhodospirillales bacterium]|nr:hypothetical protein [Acetobacter sp.]